MGVFNWQQPELPEDIKAKLRALYEQCSRPPQGGIDINAITLPAMTDLNESWYGIEIDKKKFRIVFEDETEDNIYLKIIKKEKQ